MQLCAGTQSVFDVYNVYHDESHWQINTRLTYNCAHLRSTKETLTIEYFRIILKKIWVKIFWVKIFFDKNFVGENCFSENFLGEIFLGENSLGENFFDENFLGENSFEVKNFFG